MAMGGVGMFTKRLEKVICMVFMVAIMGGLFGRPTSGYVKGQALSNYTPGQPEQLHIAYGAVEGSMVVCWATKNVSSTSDMEAESRYPDDYVVRFGRNGTDPSTWTQVNASTTVVKKYFKHRATLTGLLPGKVYMYEVGSTSLPPASFMRSHFTARRTDANYQARLAMFGDLGWTNDQVLPLLKEESLAGDIDAIILFGDMIYWANGESENSFMRDVSTMSAGGSIPFHVTPGNGDSGGNFSIYRGDFAMPGWEDNSSDSLWHSFDIGRAHIVGISTEAFYYQSSIVQSNMMAWLRFDLEKANTKEQRAKRPWIIVHYHRPAYSTNSGKGFSDKYAIENFEPVMYEYGVDLIFEGHVHNQERTWPVYNGTVLNGTSPGRPYHNARAPVHIVSGNPSNAEGTSVFKSGLADWTAWRSYTYGYCHVNIINETAMYIDTISSSLGGQAIDDAWITKDKTCNFGSSCHHQDIAMMDDICKGHRCDKTACPCGCERRNQTDPGLCYVPKPQPLRHRNLKLRSKLPQRTRVPTPTDQLQVLWDLFDKLGGDSWTRKNGWVRGTDPCLVEEENIENAWYGVSCTPVTDITMPDLYDKKLGGVTAIHMPNNGLRGNISEIDFGPLMHANLQLLDLSDNFLTGGIPESIWNGGEKLHTLQLDSPTDADDNSWVLSGSIPETAGARLPNLKHLSLQRNRLTGGIPGSFGQLDCTASYTETNKQACLFWLSGNNLTGAPPAELCNVTFDEIYLDGNDFTCGSVPCFHCSYCSKGTEQQTPCHKPCKPCNAHSRIGYIRGAKFAIE